jgi:general secretion pathway protein M
MARALGHFRGPAPVVQWWSGKSPRERGILTALASGAVATGFWVMLWQPLVRDTEAMRAAHAQSALALAEAGHMEAESAGLARAPPAVPADYRAILERALAQHGLRGAVTQLTWNEGRAHLVFGAVAYDALIPMLEALQREARLRVVEATLAARVEPGIVRAEITLAR